jgi:hypothetical protein
MSPGAPPGCRSTRRVLPDLIRYATLMRKRRIVSVASVLIVALFTASCTAIHTVPIRSTGAFVGIAAGDRLTVTTRDGYDHHIRVLTARPDALTDTDRVVYRFEDVLMVQRRELDRRKNVILVTVVGACALLTAILAATGGLVPPVTYVSIP